MTDKLRSLFGGSARSPLWTREGVFLYPPKVLWKPLDPSAVSELWSETEGGLSESDPPGLYVHIPAEVGALADCFSADEGHPYVECLKREAEFIGLPYKLPLRTLYLGGAGSGALTRLKASDIRGLLAWLKRRFTLKDLEQAVAEVDAENLSLAQAKALTAGGVDRVTCFLLPAEGPEGYQKRKAFVEGIRVCREAGVRYLSIDLAAGSPGRAAGVSYLDAEFVLGLKPDSVHVYDLGSRTGRPAENPGKAVPLARLRELVAEGQAERGPDGEGGSAQNNLQLFHATEYNATILGLGWGAVSHIRGRLVYGPSGPCFRYAQSLLAGRGPRYRGHALDTDLEKRAHLIRSLEDNARIDATTFRAAFGEEPAEAFPDYFKQAAARGRLQAEGGQIRVVGESPEARYLCSVGLYGREVLGGLVEERPPDEEDLDEADKALKVEGGADMVSRLGEPRDGRKGTVERLNDEGLRAFEKGDVAGALRLFERALLLDSTNVPALINSAAAASSSGDFAAAAAFCGQALETEPEARVRADVLSVRAGVYLRLGKRDSARADLEAALASAPAGWPRRGDVEEDLKKLA